MTAGADYPSPWVLRFDAVRSDLLVSLNLFGFAVEWAPAASEAMVRAARELVDWAGEGEGFLPRAQVGACSASTIYGMAGQELCGGAELEFLSPLAISGTDPREQPSALITGLGLRISGLARWHDVGLDELIDWRALKRSALALGVSFQDTQLVTWTRGSRKQDRKIPMRGLAGRLVIGGPIPPDIATLLALGETCHMGADVAYGCGRYRVAT